jgi:hypothetical protein
MEKRELGSCVAERVVVVPKKAQGAPSLFDLLHGTPITCHGGGSAHQASICLECERFVACEVGPDLTTVSIRCYWFDREKGLKTKPVRKWARGTVVPEMRCDSCGEYDGTVVPHPKMASVAICEDCLDLSRQPLDYAELGVGD